jgi:hypothetical protein
MSTDVLESIDATAPVSSAYNQWTQRFDTFPKFVEGVERIEQLDPTHTHRVTRIGGISREFDAEITEQCGRRRGAPSGRATWRTSRSSSRLAAPRAAPGEARSGALRGSASRPGPPA